MGNELINWWAAYPEIAVGPGVCPASPQGQPQGAPAVVSAADWQSAFVVAAVLTVVVTVLMVLVTYETRAVGRRFWARWWICLGLTALASALASFAWLTWLARVGTQGCEYGEVVTSLPLGPALSRVTVSLVQGALLFVVGSWLLTLVARWSRRPTWYNNSRIPFRFP